MLASFTALPDQPERSVDGQVSCPNIRGTAATILERSNKPIAIAVLAERALKTRGKKSGKMFVQNLGTALRGDQRFRRMGRGIYALR